MTHETLTNPTEQHYIENPFADPSRNKEEIVEDLRSGYLGSNESLHPSQADRIVIPAEGGAWHVPLRGVIDLGEAFSERQTPYVLLIHPPSKPGNVDTPPVHKDDYLEVRHINNEKRQSVARVEEFAWWVPAREQS